MSETKIAKKAINQMRQILVGIVLGRLQHDQTAWHCGSAHCVAGWNTALNHKQLYKEQLKQQLKNRGCADESELDDWVVYMKESDMGDGLIAQKDWGLSDYEAGVLFDGDAALGDQIGMIEYLAAGHRYTVRDWTDELEAYTRRYTTHKARMAWALEHDKEPKVCATKRPNSEFVKELLCPVQTAEPIVEQVEVETVKVR